MVKLTAAIVALMAALACANAATAPTADAAKSGEWGATGVSLEVTAKGGTIEYDCGHGTLDQPLTVDRSGRFTVTGRHFREGGPSRDDDTGQPARYDGIVSGDAMALTVTLTDAKTTLGTFSLAYGHSPVLHKCL
ncbi:MAG TPA: hypothetical protein VKH42_21520 [Vicinamibacterales bacterium]|nr:hypothetical protein [Vicinamibacterales bacterium]